MSSEPQSSRSSEIHLLPMPDLEEDSDLHEREKTSPPPILRRRRTNLLQIEQHQQHQRTDTPDSGNQSDFLLHSYNQPSSSSQIGTAPTTPIKQLPFSPSQFLNSLSPEPSWPRASTPKGSPGPLTTPQPSTLRRGTSSDSFSNRKENVKGHRVTNYESFQTARRRARPRLSKTRWPNWSGEAVRRPSYRRRRAG